MSRRTDHRCRRAFSLVEVTVSTGLVVMLGMFLSSAWIQLGRPLVQTAARCRIAQEAVLALDCLGRDLGGRLQEGKTGEVGSDKLVGWTHPGDSELLLCFDSTSNPNGAPDWASPDTIVAYQVVNNRLVRWNQSTGVEYVAAQNVDSLLLQNLGDDVQITLTFTYRGVSLTYNFVAKKP